MYIKSNWDPPVQTLVALETYHCGDKDSQAKQNLSRKERQALHAIKYRSDLN